MRIPRARAVWPRPLGGRTPSRGLVGEVFVKVKGPRVLPEELSPVVEVGGALVELEHRPVKDLGCLVDAAAVHLFQPSRHHFCHGQRRRYVAGAWHRQ